MKFSIFKKCSFWKLFIGFLTVLGMTTSTVLACPSILNNPRLSTNLFKRLEEGGVIMVLRHMQKGKIEYVCPKNSTEFLPKFKKFRSGEVDGITRIGRHQAIIIGERLSNLRAAAWEIIGSGQCRTRQTVKHVFPSSTNITWEPKIQEPKFGGKPRYLKKIINSFNSKNSNLALITHSQLIEQLKIPELQMKNGIGVFYDSKLKGRNRLLGCALPEEWEKIKISK